jgi:hypothetical protein
MIIVHDTADPVLVAGREEDATEGFSPKRLRDVKRFEGRCLIEAAGYSREAQDDYIVLLAQEAEKIGDQLAIRWLAHVLPIMVVEYAVLGSTQRGHA